MRVADRSHGLGIAWNMGRGGPPKSVCNFSRPLLEKARRTKRIRVIPGTGDPGGKGLPLLKFQNNFDMKKFLKSIATIVLLGALCFLGGEWPEDTPRNKVLAFDGSAMATVLVCGLYLKKTWERDAR